MATTRHFTRHVNAGETIAEAIKDCTDYGKNPDKTRGGDLISSYECDPATVDAEFLLSKSKYKAITVSYTHLQARRRENGAVLLHFRHGQHLQLYRCPGLFADVQFTL